MVCRRPLATSTMNDFVPFAVMRQPKFLSAPSHSVRVPSEGNSAALIANSVSVRGTDLAPRRGALGWFSMLRHVAPDGHKIKRFQFDTCRRVPLCESMKKAKNLTF